MLDRVEYLLRKLRELYVLNRLAKSDVLRIPGGSLSWANEDKLKEVRAEVQDIRQKLGGSEKRRLKARAIEIGMEKLI